MARYEFVKGLPVITMAEGKQIGKVDDLIVDPETKAVSWLRIHSGGMGTLGGVRLWVPTTAVHAVGEHAVTIDAEADARTAADAPEALALVDAKRGIIGNKVITEAGVRLGMVGDYEFNPDTYALTFLSVPAGTNGVGDRLRIPGDKVLTIGEDVIVVATTAVVPSPETTEVEMQPAP